MGNVKSFRRCLAPEMEQQREELQLQQQGDQLQPVPVEEAVIEQTVWQDTEGAFVKTLSRKPTPTWQRWRISSRKDTSAGIKPSLTDDDYFDMCKVPLVVSVACCRIASNMDGDNEI